MRTADSIGLLRSASGLTPPLPRTTAVRNVPFRGNGKVEIAVAKVQRTELHEEEFSTEKCWVYTRR